jgi:hypothetical protein
MEIVFESKTSKAAKNKKLEFKLEQFKQRALSPKIDMKT